MVAKLRLDNVAHLPDLQQAVARSHVAVRQLLQVEKALHLQQMSLADKPSAVAAA